jgi:hypothetical protein
MGEVCWPHCLNSQVFILTPDGLKAVTLILPMYGLMLWLRQAQELLSFKLITKKSKILERTASKLIFVGGIEPYISIERISFIRSQSINKE